MASEITIDDYYDLKFLKSHDISHNGKKVVYSLAVFEASEDEDEFHHKEMVNLWLLDTENDQHRQLTYGEVDSNPCWSPDDLYLAFTSKREEQSQLYLLPMEGGEARQLTTLENGVASKPIWMDSGRKLLFTAVRDQKLPDTKQPYYFNRDFYRMDAMGNVDRVLQELYMYDLDSNELVQLTDDQLNHTQPLLSPDETQVLLLSMFEENQTDGIFPRLYLFDVSSKEMKKLCDHHITVANWVDGRTIAFVGGDPDRKIGSKTDLFTVDIVDGEVTNHTEKDTYGISGGFQSDMPTAEARLPRLLITDDLVYCNVQVGGNQEIRSVRLGGDSAITTVVGGDQANFVSSLRNGKLFFVASTPHNPLDLFVLDLATQQTQRLTRLNEMLLKEKNLPEVMPLHLRGEDSAEIEGWILLPKQSQGPFPTLLNIHGGPHAGWGNIFQFENLYLCGAGYAVLMINQRGSTGYGDEFSTKIVGDWGNYDYKDLMSGVDYVISEGLSDPERLGCFGISGGGNLSSWIVGQTNRFKAAIPENPVTNWQSFYGVSDIGRWFATKEMGGLPWEIPDVYHNASPITHAHNCKTPTLMIQHDADLRCPAEQSEQFFAVLRDVGCVVEMLRMPSTPHAGSLIGPLEIREKQNTEILNWFNKYVI